MKKIFPYICFLLFTPMLFAQGSTKSFSFKKGEIMDIILLRQNAAVDTLFDRYRKTAFPVAFEYSFQPQPGFAIQELTLGNHTPSSFIFGKWATKEKREGFLTAITSRVPDFHEQRRNIFQYFSLTYYQISEDIQFSINTKKYTSVTAFWKKDNKKFINFLKRWKEKVTNAGGKVILQLKNGQSPTGYYYNPDMLYIITWNHQSNFREFAKNNSLSMYDSLRHVHQFAIK
ncbi:hypothetical protein HN014_00610 [Aquimarina sp. TRL1]|uniref:hypothetical protein n=1 Tax=Aquimarina sp. (strain TRL1) TaxID=2736252 RepID=UPI00158B56AE|nr:hypothetical protein [Aquimarina sp. TRL1]QKX03479.1 hypothetical protein HN014_00610 [Aquimarina sp. TRL1]